MPPRTGPTTKVLNGRTVYMLKRDQHVDHHPEHNPHLMWVQGGPLNPGLSAKLGGTDKTTKARRISHRSLYTPGPFLASEGDIRQAPGSRVWAIFKAGMWFRLIRYNGQLPLQFGSKRCLP